jgi:succinate dehydrogenase/fumarate reductase cytochrome b subunit
MKGWVMVMTFVIVAVLVYMPLSGIGALVWRWVYVPFLDAVDRGDAWAMTTLAVVLVAFVICAWESSREYELPEREGDA